MQVPSRNLDRLEGTFTDTETTGVVFQACVLQQDKTIAKESKISAVSR